MTDDVEDRMMRGEIDDAIMEAEEPQRCRRGNNMAKSTPSFEFTSGGIQEFVILL